MTQDNKIIKVAIFCEGDLEDVLEFGCAMTAGGFTEGASYGADRYAGSLIAITLPLEDWMDKEYGHLRGWEEFKEKAKSW